MNEIVCNYLKKCYSKHKGNSDRFADCHEQVFNKSKEIKERN